MDRLNLPKHLMVKKDIMDRLDREEFVPGDLLPSERELIERYEVSRITVRKALADLENEGYLYKVHGKGTYVKGGEKDQNLFELTSCTKDIIRLGMTPTRKVLSAEVLLADRSRQRKLNLPEGEKIFELSRVYYADQDSINWTTTSLAYRYFPGIESYDFSKISLYDVIETKYGVTIDSAQRSVQAVVSTGLVSEYLDIPDGVPLLLFKCNTYGIVKAKKVPIEVFKSYYKTDKYGFYINQTR